MIKFFIPGIPVAKGRPKFSTIGEIPRAYTPKKTRAWETYFEWRSKPYRPSEPLEGPLEIHLVFSMPRPKSLPKNVIHHIKKPDIDNMQKSVIDALENAAFFKNDSQFVYKTASKIYSYQPGVNVIIKKHTSF